MKLTTPTRSLLLAHVACFAALGAGCVDDAVDPPEPFAEYPRQEYRHVLPDGRVAVGTGVRNGDTLLIEGDVVIPAHDDAPPIAEAAVANDLWPSKTIHYEFSPAVDATTRQAVLSAMGPWRAAGVRFRQRTTQSNYVTITTAYYPQYQWVCAATVGYQAYNVYFAGNACRTRDYVHEWGHVLGLFHEHSRNDRGQHVITDPSLGGTIGSTGYDSGPYDFGSIMHYDAYARNHDGSVNFDSVLITPLDGRPLSSFGWNDGPSGQDLETIFWLYWTEPPCGPGTGTICP